MSSPKESEMIKALVAEGVLVPVVPTPAKKKRKIAEKQPLFSSNQLCVMAQHLYTLMNYFKNPAMYGSYKPILAKSGLDNLDDLCKHWTSLGYVTPASELTVSVSKEDLATIQKAKTKATKAKSAQAKKAKMKAPVLSESGGYDLSLINEQENPNDIPF